MTTSRPVIHVVDDDRDVRTGYGRLLRANGYDVRLHDSAEALLRSPGLADAGCVLLDLRMPGLSGLGLQAELARLGVPLPVVFLTGHADVPSSVRAMKGGAVDFLQKPASSAELLRAVETALARDAARRAGSAAQADAAERLRRLTAREREVLAAVVAGQRNPEIARALGIEEQTVRVYRMRGMEKLAVASVPALVDLWREAGM